MKITYYFGAGASFYSMPLVDSFVFRFDRFIDYLNTNLKFDMPNDFRIWSIRFRNEVYNHASFDTFFKKLFHAGKKEDVLKYKQLLYIYFLYEHLIDVNNKSYQDNGGVFNNKDDISGNNKFLKQKNVDTRYEALIAGLLKPNKSLDLFADVNFITWNYDLNLLIAIQNFLAPKSTFSSLLRDLKPRRMLKREKFSLTHLNGIFDFDINSIKMPLGEIELNELLKTHMRRFRDNDPSLINSANRISFAWENNSLKKVLEKTKKSIEESDYVVFVGYSFPLYNRLVDQFLLTGIGASDKVFYIQDLDAQNLIKHFEEIFSFNSGSIEGQSYFKQKSNIKSVENCKSFFVPQIIYKKGEES
jgi:hypothetical protein